MDAAATESIVDDFHRYLAQTTPARKDLVVVAGHGSTLVGADGRTYCDLTSGIAVANVGHTHPRVVDAVRRTVGELAHVNVYGRYIVPQQVELARRIAAVAPGDIEVTFPCNSGAEAIDGALKLARLATRRPGIIAFEGDFHGRSLGSLSVTWKPEYRAPFEPLLPGVHFVPAFDAAAAEAVMARGDIGCVVVEPVQGEGGVRPAPDGFLADLRAACDRHDVLFVADEVQGGFGRAGHWFSIDHWGVVPDILVMAKGLGGGLPIGAFSASPALMAAFRDNPLSHLTTFGGNAVCAAAACASIDVIHDEGLVERSRTLGDTLGGWLGELVTAGIGFDAVRWAGLWAGLDLVDPTRTLAFVRACQERGVLIGSMLHNAKTVRIAPPLVIGEDELRRAVEVIADVARAELVS